MISSWSFSRLTVFEQCKFRAKLQMIDKIPDPTPRPAADRGTEIHQTCEDYVRGTAALRKEMRHFEEEFVVLRDLFKKGKVSLEGEWGFTKDWEPCDYKKAWLRAKADAVVWLSPTHVVVIDYKTGKRFGNEVKHGEQLQLYALCMMVRHPEIERVTVELWYLDQNEMAPLDLRQQPIGHVAGQIRLETQPARERLFAQRLGLVALGVVVGKSLVVIFDHVGIPFGGGSSGAFRISDNM